MRAIAATTLFVAGCLLVCSDASAQVPTQAQAGTIDVRIVGEPRNPWTEPSTILGVIGVLGGLGGVLLQQHWHRNDQEKAAARAERERLQAHVFDSLKWFEGRSQKRSIGIAVIEGNWSTFDDMRPTWLAILTNQAVYLLAESDSKDASHERANLDRITRLLVCHPATLSADQNSSIGHAIEENRSGKRLRGIETESLDDWKSKLSSPPQNGS
jgi:hypothetical protein